MFPARPGLVPYVSGFSANFWWKGIAFENGAYTPAHTTLTETLLFFIRVVGRFFVVFSRSMTTHAPSPEKKENETKNNTKHEHEHYEYQQMNSS